MGRVLSLSISILPQPPLALSRICVTSRAECLRNDFSGCFCASSGELAYAAGRMFDGCGSGALFLPVPAAVRAPSDALES